MMKLPLFLFALLVTMCCAVGTILFTPEPVAISPADGSEVKASHGIPHPSISTMLQGGDGSARYSPVRIATWVFAVCMISIFCSLLVLSSRKEARYGWMSRLLWIGGALHLACMIGLMLCYESYLSDPDPRLHAAFPAPTAWMLYVLWPVPLFYVFLYVLTFDRWTFRPEDEQAFAALVELSNETRGDEATQGDG